MDQAEGEIEDDYEGMQLIFMGLGGGNKYPYFTLSSVADDLRVDHPMQKAKVVVRGQG